MGDERDQDAQRMPLWPPDSVDTADTGQAESPAAPAQEASTPQGHGYGEYSQYNQYSDVRDPQNPWAAPQPTPQPAPQPAPYGPPSEPANRPASNPLLSEASTMRFSAAPAASPESTITEAPTMRVSAAPASPHVAPGPQHAPGNGSAQPARPETAGQPGHLAAPFAPAPRLTAAPPATSPAAPPATSPERRKGLSLVWRLGITLAICLVLLGGAVGLYAYASSLAAQPQRLMTSYCAALTHDNYHAAYSLLSPSAQGREAEARYLSDASARDTISGRVTSCVASPTQTLSPLSFLRSPRSLIFNATIKRKQAATGQIALTRDATGWRVAALSSSLQGIDLGPLYTEQALCTAFSERAYNQAYALLSIPYQKEQGDAATFARAFGATLTLTGCAANLTTYSVNPADQQATLDATLSISVASTNGAAASSFSLPARLSLVREATGWRVDAITPQLAQ